MFRSPGSQVFGLCLTVLLCSIQARAYAACPDSVVNVGETCDDGNATNGDGCASSCQIEAGYVCTGAPSLCCFSDAAAAYALIGSSTTNSTTGEVTLTTATGGQAGFAWYKQRISLAANFRVNLKLYLGNRDANGADGGAILFHRHASGFSKTGSSGGGLGGDFSPLVGVEFDDWDNGAGSGDIAADHVSIFKTGVTTQLSSTACMNNACSNFEDGLYHRYEVIWTASSNLMEVKIDGVSRISLTNDLVANVFGGDPNNIIFGFAASTGGSYNLQKFCPAAPEGFIVPRDEDADGVDDSTDRDDDNDGVGDTTESANVFGTDDPGGDHDTDGVPNWEDTNYWTTVLNNSAQCMDTVAPIGKCDSTPTSIDADSDGIPNHLDPDSDNDTVKDVVEAGGTDANNDGKLDGCSPVTVDGSCMNGGLTLIDSDNDGTYDIYDTDSDNDGIPDSTEGSCQSPNSGANCNTGDADGDGLTNAQECANPMSCPDTDSDGTPNYLDTDSDNDALNDMMETNAAAAADPCLPTTIAAACTSGDADGDGHTNGTECPNSFACPDTDGDGTRNHLDTDSDNDGVTDSVETSAAALNPCAPSTGSPYCTSGDADLDGVSNSVECQNPLAACADSDSDGVLDYLDTDSDNDGVLDGTDINRTNVCAPSTAVAGCASGDADSDGVNNATECPNPSACVDTDSDGTPDFQDTDADGDGVADNTDGSRVDACSPSTLAVRCTTGDTDNDGLTNGNECPNPSACRDTDGDSTPDYVDTDSDADGTTDLLDSSPIDACQPSTIVVRCTTGDTDGDSVDNGTECPTPNACPDTDNDGVLDYVDPDSDSDGENDQTDTLRLDPCSPDNDAAACSSGDPDEDGVQNSVECATPLACPDTDGDGDPDYLDTDSDADGVQDISDATRVNPCMPTTIVLACTSGDWDGDGVSNGVECPNRASCPDTDNDNTPNYRDTDSDDDGVADGGDSQRLDPCDPSGDVPVCGTGDADEDGVPNSAECTNPYMCSDVDMDGMPDYLDTDSDNDGTPDLNDSGTVDPCDPSTDAATCASGDADGDGVNNGAECPNPASCVDSDNDETPDYLDTDSDNDGEEDGDDDARGDPCDPDDQAAACSGSDSDGDGISNGDECPDPLQCPDTDEDGTPDFEDTDSDNDGAPDEDDDNGSNPCLPDGTAAACGGGDADADGIDNATECPDALACPDTDEDGTPDYRDTDADGDGSLDDSDSTRLDPCQPSTDAAACGSGDQDGDGLTNGQECEDPLSCSDTDEDGTPDYRDTDSDGDGTLDDSDGAARDACAPSTNPARCTSGDADGDGIDNGSECADPTACADADGDGTPDFLDSDADDDGTPDDSDDERTGACEPSSDAAACDDGDADQDGVPNGLECPNPQDCPDTDRDEVPDFEDNDADGDGRPDLEECATQPCADADEDGVADYLERSDRDTDGDGQRDDLDSDADGDGVPDGTECSTSPVCRDSDDDGIIDALDAADGDGNTGDSDGDGLLDDTECGTAGVCIDSDGDHIPDYMDTDSDADGVEDEQDPDATNPCNPDSDLVVCTTGDADDDGVPNGSECSTVACPDTDNDGLDDHIDPDADNDGVPDSEDSERLLPCLPNANAIACASGDYDGDGARNDQDPEPGDACKPNGMAVACASGDADGDGIKNNVDTQPSDACAPNVNAVQCGMGDADGDGVKNSVDARPSDACRPSANAVKCGRGDTDGDGVLNRDDAQPEDPCQPASDALACASGDSDGDGVSNEDDEDATNACVPELDAPACDEGDYDGDGVENASDAEPEDACVPETAAVRCASGDADGDGLANELECPNPLECVDSDGDGTPDFSDLDSDDDGIADARECEAGDCKDTDADGIIDALDPDDDGDGIPTNEEDQDGSGDPSDDDANMNGVPDYLDEEPVDSDGDGVPDREECGAADSCTDTDQDGTPDRSDEDDDGDGLSTEDELQHAAQYGNDVDGDGVPNHLDTDADGDGVPDSEELSDLNYNGIPDYLEVYSGPRFIDDDCGCRAGPGGAGRDLGALWLLPLLALLERRRRRTGSWLL